MDYNWGDPKKNSLLTSRMMAKAEVTRKKRLTSVKSTLSNQLHPSIENKLRKKKKTPDSARHLSGEEDNHNFNNNDSHDLHFKNADHTKMVPQLPSDDESCSLDTIRHDAFPVPSLSNNRSMFDEFGLNAAADGLFHPASTIEAFTEHDAKYHQEIQGTSEKPRSGPRRARSGSEYPPSRENHRLPSIPSGKTRRTRPDPKLQPAGNSGSAPASMTTNSSLSKLLDADEPKRSLSATRSDSNLYAPRRLDIVSSSADQNALDFLEHELDIDNNSPHQSPVENSLLVTRELDNNEIPDGGNSVVPPLNFSLATKFEELKRIMKSNREKQDSARQLNEQHPADQVISISTGASLKASDRTDQGKKSAIRAASSGLSDKKAGEASSKEKVSSKKRSTPAARASTDMNSGSSNSKRAMGNQVSGTAPRTISSRTTIVRAPSIRSKKEMKVHSGVSLSDLKAEHREALQMLKELGGPMDPDYQLADLDVPVSSKSNGIGGTGTKVSGSSIIHSKPSNLLQGHNSTTTPPTSAGSSVSIVTKLRESISSGRISSREASPRTSSSDEKVDEPAQNGRMAHKGEDCNTQEKTKAIDTALASSNQTPAEGTTSSVAVYLDKVQVGGGDPAVIMSSLSPPPLSPSTDTADPWKLYDDDAELDDEDEDNNYEISSGVKGASTTDRSGDRYSDEDFESDW